MNNLKRVLSLGLAGTMLTGMMAMGASAAEFTDAEDINNVDAVNTLVALNVINGKEDGSYFDPQGTVTRAEMAKMIAVTMNGGSDTTTGTKVNPTFTDIKGHWAESYIEYCADMGIISGRGDGTFDPAGEVTGLEATKMVLTALGYNATAYKLVGNSWAVRTDELARTADPSLYENLGGVMMASSASRETAAQLIWNGLQNKTVTVSPSTNTSNGEVTWRYDVSTYSLLNQRYDAHITEGTYVGNFYTGDAAYEGDIKVGSSTFPSDMGIENIGEKVKVVWKDGKGGTADTLDRKDVIFGVFNTHETTVYNICKNDIQDVDTDNDKIKFGGVKYDYKTTGYIYTNYGNSAAVAMNDTNMGNLEAQSGDTIKFICNDDGEITDAYVVTYNIAKVTAVTADKVSLSSVGALEIDEHDIYEGIAKNDVVVYTKYYDASTTDVFYTVMKPETVEGTLNGFKQDGSSNYINVVVDGTTYKTHNPSTTFPANLTDDTLTSLSGQITKGVRLYLINGFVAAVDSTEESTSKYAVVTDKDIGTLGSSLNPTRVTLLLADGTEVTRNLHKDSVSATNTSYSSPAVGDLVKYTTLNDTTVKVVEAVTSDTTITGTGSGNAKFWNTDTKRLTYTAATTNVAASDAPLFVARDTNSDSTIDEKDSFNAYTLRDLDDIANTASGVKVRVFRDTTNNQIKAAYAVLTVKPVSESSNTLYGLVTAYVGERTNADDDTVHQYTVAVNGDEEVVVELSVNTHIAKGDLVTFDERADRQYATGDITVLVTADDTTCDSNTNWTLAAIREYAASTRMLKIYGNTSWNAASSIYTGTADTYTVATDVTVVYVNGDDFEDGPEVGIDTVFNVNKGYANALVHKNTDGVVDVIIIETSGDANLADKGVADNRTAGFGARP